MKRGCPDHPKTKALAAKLLLRRFEVVGILECLFHFTAGYAKRGDIGKWTNQEIAASMEWKGDADTLIDGLIVTGWIDVDPTFRLLVHDWEDHADQTVSRSEEVKKLGFASAALANASQPILSSPLLSSPEPSLARALPSPSPSSANGRKLADEEDEEDIWKRVKQKADDLFVLFHGRKPRIGIRRKIAACIYLSQSGEFPPRWLDENADLSATEADQDPWCYLWSCLANEAAHMGKDLGKLVSRIELPAELSSSSRKEPSL